MKRRNTNWHEATVCAIQIDLKEYSNLLQYLPEYPLGKKRAFRIDLLVIKKLTDIPLENNAITKIFSTYNLFEIKGIHSTLTSDAYYKTHGYAGIYINSHGETNQLSRHDLTLSFISRKYPRKLITHLTKDCKLSIEKTAPGVYYVGKEMYSTQIIVTSELSPHDNLYLRCLTNNLNDSNLTNQLMDDYKNHQDQEIYTKYLNQLTHANKRKDGTSPMYCEGLFELFGTSSKEIAKNAADKATAEANKKADATIASLEKRIKILEAQLAAKN